MAAFLTGVAAAASVDYYACAPLRCSRLGGISGRPGYHRYSRPQHARRFPMPCALHKLPSNYLTLFPKPLTLGLVASTDLDDAAKLIVDAFLSIGGSSADTVCSQHPVEVGATDTSGLFQKGRFFSPAWLDWSCLGAAA
eukprot:6187195-Pleurochrysis_carterae.AAC.1